MANITTWHSLLYCIFTICLKYCIQWFLWLNLTVNHANRWSQGYSGTVNIILLCTHGVGRRPKAWQAATQQASHLTAPATPPPLATKHWHAPSVPHNCCSVASNEQHPHLASLVPPPPSFLCYHSTSGLCLCFLCCSFLSWRCSHNQNKLCPTAQTQITSIYKPDEC